MSEEQAQLDHWMKEVAPSADLRTWWGHDPDRMDEFAHRYEQELSDNEHSEAVDELIKLIHENSRVTLFYGAKDEAVNHARLLQDYLRRPS